MVSGIPGIPYRTNKLARCLSSLELSLSQGSRGLGAGPLVASVVRS